MASPQLVENGMRRVRAQSLSVLGSDPGLTPFRRVAESLQEVAGLSPEPLRVIHDPVRSFPQCALTEEDRNKLAGWLNGKVRIIAIGSLKAQKGFDILLYALAELRQRVDAKFLILGEDGLRGELMTLADKLRVSEHFCLPGFRDNPSTFLRHAHVFVLSSNWEGFGNVIVEALGEGVPVVSTDCKSGPGEILGGGRYGRLVRPGDWQQMAAAVEATLEGLLEPILLKGRAADFRPELQAARYLEELVR